MTPERITFRDLETLEALDSASNGGADFVRPMDVGGHDGSHHHKTLQKLVRLDFAEEQRFSRPAINSRPGVKYRITIAGRDRVAMIQDKRRIG